MRVFLFIAICIISLTLPWWITLIAAIAYSLARTSYELIALAVLVDAYYGTALGLAPMPLLYTLGAILIVWTIEVTKPYLAVYEV